MSLAEEILYLGPTPLEEECCQVGQSTSQEMYQECCRYKEQLKRMFPIPEGVIAAFHVKKFGHDFGEYYEVILLFDDENERSASFAYETVEPNLPLNWS